MVYSNDPPVPIRVPTVLICFMFAADDHEVGIFKGILISTHFICSVVDTERLVFVGYVFLDHNLISLCRIVFIFVAIVFQASKSSQKVVLGLGRKFCSYLLCQTCSTRCFRAYTASRVVFVFSKPNWKLDFVFRPRGHLMVYLMRSSGEHFFKLHG